MAIQRLVFVWGMFVFCVAGNLASADNHSEEALVGNAQEIESYVDGLLTGYMGTHNIPGMTISVVRNNRVLLSKGYGWANIEDRVLVDANKTLFRIGSISKTMMWTAVMQLVEQGKLDLDTDVNTYLEAFKIPEAFGQPITINHLMTHTPGFEDGALGYLFEENAEDVLSPEDFLIKYLPARVRPPGSVPSYSNYGAALAAYIVAQVSGKDFETYAEDHIFTPLGMTQTTFREPLGEDNPRSVSPALEDQFADGYFFMAGQHQPIGFEYISQIAGAGGAGSTARDMANYMMAHLNLGTFEGRRILKEETARQMRTPNLASLDTGVTHMAHGFVSSRLEGFQTFEHSGGTLGFGSQMILIPDLNLGIFYSRNEHPTSVAAVPDLNETLARSIVQFLQGKKADVLPGPPPEDFLERGQRFVGTYGVNRRSYTKLEKIQQLAGQISVVLDEGGYLLVSLGATQFRFVEIEPLTFQYADGEAVFKFEEDEVGNVSRFHILGTMAADRVGFWNSASTFFLFTGLTVFLAVTTLLSAWHRWRHQYPGSGADRVWNWASTGVSVSVLLMGLMLVVTLAELGPLGIKAFYAFPTTGIVWFLTTVLVFSVAVVIATIGLVPVWRNSDWAFGQKLHYTLLCVSGIALVSLFYEWNMLGFNYY